MHRIGVWAAALTFLGACSLDTGALVPSGPDSSDGDSSTSPRDASPDSGPMDAGPRDTGVRTVDSAMDGPSDSGSIVDTGPDAPAPLLRSCREILVARPSTLDGPQLIAPFSPDVVMEVYCDMTTDEGGWTLVASTRRHPPTDSRIDYHGDLATLHPLTDHKGVVGLLR
ncbi:MAG: hypothetical protein JRH11_19630, partial [Deltaproteobacteria bacterium]|nr:hypothetical protein [Deltaproteobacteria bacterium]